MKKQNIFFSIFIGFLFVFVIVSSVSSFPSKWRLFELKYGYRTSCNTCHVDGGGSDNNDYGMAFHHLGENLAAFGKLETKDSDEDGFTNLEEIKGKSNPGDPKSTPKNPRNFLSERAETFIPKKLLARFFPQADSFALTYATLDDKETVKLEKSLGINLLEDERVPTFFWAYKKTSPTRKLGIILLFFEMEGHEHLMGGVATDILGRVEKVIIFKQQVKKGLPLEEFCQQFMGKTFKDNFVVGKDMKAIPDYNTFSQKIANYVKKSSWLISQYGFKNKT